MTKQKNSVFVKCCRYKHSARLAGEYQKRGIHQDPAGCCQIVVANTPKRDGFITKTHATSYNSSLVRQNKDKTCGKTKSVAKAISLHLPKD